MSGRKDDTGKLRYSLLPVGALRRVVEVLDFGARKYTRRGECTCPARSVRKTNPLDGREGTVEAATSTSSDRAIQNSPRDSESTLRHGPQSTPSELPSTKQGATPRTELTRPSPHECEIGRSEGHTGSQQPRSIHCSPPGAPFVVASIGFESTTTTEPGRSEEDSVTPATSGSASSSDPSNGLSGHSTTCGVHEIVSGVDNWQLVPDATRRYTDALMRHVEAWREGERLDPESKLPHLAHAICCALFLIWFEEKGKK